MFGIGELDLTEMCLIFIVIFVALLFIFIYMGLRRIKEGAIPKGDMNTLVPAIDYALRTRGWQPTWNPGKGKLAVTKDSIVATDIYLNQVSDGTIEISHGASATGLGWVIVIVLFLFTSIIGLIAAIVLHVMSRNFAKNEVVPIILQVSSLPPPYMQYPQVPYYEAPPPIYHPEPK